MTRICIPLTTDTSVEMAREIETARAAGADMIELRLDYLREYSPAAMDALLLAARRFSGEVIATCRHAAEGGRYQGDEAARIGLLELAAQGGADYVDLEYAAWRAWSSPVLDHAGSRRIAAGGAKLILSKHNFARTPEELDAIFEDLLATPADVVKLACRAESIVDALCMLDALRTARAAREVIALSMGETGILTRVLARKFGALLTFAALDAGKESAPGQPTIQDLRELYRWDSIGPATRVYGVVGCPVAHSMSPAIHNAAFGAVGHDGVYLPMRVEPAYESFAAFLDGCLTRPWLDLCGLSVTIPHKENLLRYVEAHGGQIDPLTRRIGAANTFAIEPHGLYAFNTDYRGALDALCQGLGCESKDLAGLPVAVLGAGGVSRAIVAGLADCGCHVTIYNRTAQKATALAAEFGADALPFDQRIRPGTRVIINCTSIGMWPHTGDTPRGGAGILPEEKDLAVFDTVYNPIETRLLREAREQGHKTIDGVAMFVNQAAAQFERWTGRSAPTDVMRKIVVRRLSRG